MAARNGLIAATLAQRGYTASERSLDGPQGFLAAMDAEHRDLSRAVERLDTQWEILDTGITVKLYPSCAATHPTIDALLDLRYGERFGADDVDAIDVLVDSMTPRLLIHDRPATGLEGKFSMPFCAAAAIVDGHVGMTTFEVDRIQSPAIQALMAKVTMRAHPAFDSTPPLSHSHVTVRLRDGRVLTRLASGARGYPSRPASEMQLASKFTECASRVLPVSAADDAWSMLGRIEEIADMSTLIDLLVPAAAGSMS
jgi:2-methylcitrate dehydratase PrpD